MPTLSTPVFTPSALDPRASSLLAGYPPHLFTEKLHFSIELMHRYTLELSTDLLGKLDVTSWLDTWRTADELCRLMSFDPRFCPALTWLMDEAVELGYLEISATGACTSYRVSCPSWSPELAALRGIGLSIDPANAATLDLLDAAAALYPPVARAEAKADEALFDPQNIGLWLAYFHNDNPTYAVNNWTAALAAVERLAGRPKMRILEIGAGAGSGSEILLRLLSERDLLMRVERYVVTEPSPFFLRRAQRELTRRYPGLPLEFRALDINNAWVSQAGADGEFDLVYGINVMHVARDLAYSLREARAALAEGGWLVMGECLHARARKPIFPELIFQMLDSFRNVQTDPEFRPAPGFMTPGEWRRACSRAGFDAQAVEPDVERIAEFYPNFLAAAVCGRKEKLFPGLDRLR